MQKKLPIKKFNSKVKDASYWTECKTSLFDVTQSGGRPFCCV